MASRTATVKGLEILRGADHALTSSTTGALRHGILYIANETGSAVTGGTDTLDCAIATALAAQLRNGKTCTLRGYGSIAYRNSLIKNSSGVFREVGATVSNNSGTLQLTPKNVSDYSTNETWAAADSWEGWIGVSIAWTEA